jgi:hypothetical protein
MFAQRRCGIIPHGDVSDGSWQFFSRMAKEFSAAIKALPIAQVANFRVNVELPAGIVIARLGNVIRSAHNN